MSSENSHADFNRFGNCGLPLRSGKVLPFSGEVSCPAVRRTQETQEVKYCANIVQTPDESEPTGIPEHVLQRVCLIHGGANVTGFTYRIQPPFNPCWANLPSMTLKQLKEEARSLGVQKDLIDDLDDDRSADGPKNAAVMLVLKALDIDIEYEDDSWCSFLANNTGWGRRCRRCFDEYGYTPIGEEYRQSHQYARVHNHNTHLGTMFLILWGVLSEVLEYRGAVVFEKALPSDWSDRNKFNYALSPGRIFWTAYCLCWVARLVVAFRWAGRRLHNDMLSMDDGASSDRGSSIREPQNPRETEVTGLEGQTDGINTADITGLEGGINTADITGLGGMNRANIRGDLMTFSFEPLLKGQEHKCRMQDHDKKYFRCCTCLWHCGRRNRHPVFSEDVGYAHLSSISIWTLQFLYFMFELLALPKDTLNLQLNLSPFSHVQQWCAFKKDGARTIIVTYPFRGFWLYENFASTYPSHVLRFTSSLVQTVIRIALCVPLLHDFATLWSLWSFLPSLWRLNSAWSKISRLKRAEKHFKKYLGDQIHGPAHLAHSWQGSLVSEAARNMWDAHGFGAHPQSPHPQAPEHNTLETALVPQNTGLPTGL